MFDLSSTKLFLLAVFASFIFSAAAHSDELSVPLYKVAPIFKAVNLNCTAGEYNLQIPIPKRWSIKKAVLRFGYINSSALLKQNSQLVISLNGTPLVQLKLDPLAPNSYAEVELPGTMLTPGYNALNFKVNQHYTLNCETPCAPELWTTLKLEEALISFQYDLDPVPLKLSALPDLIFDPTIIPEANLHLITDKLTEDTMTSVGIVTSGAAQRFDYRKAVFSLSDQTQQGLDNILVGEKSFVEGFLKNIGVNIHVEKPMLKVLHLPIKQDDGRLAFDDRHVLLVITGRNADEIKLAAETMSIMSIPFPDGDEMEVSEFVLPEIGLYKGKQMLVTDENYPFKKLDFNSHTFNGLNPSPENIVFRLPPDFFIKPNQYATISLDFSYGAGMKQDSVLNILLNGQFVATVRLDNPNGGVIADYRVGIPTFLFKPGTNSLTFQPQMTPLFGEQCHFLQTGNLQLTLFDSSHLEFPPMPHRIELPRLDLLPLNGFPYTRWPDGYETEIILSEANQANATAALNIISMITQKNGYPLFGIKVGVDPKEKWDKEIIFIGKMDTVPPEYFENAPLKLGKTNKVPYPLYQDRDVQTSMSWSQQTSSVSSDKGIIMQLSSPFKSGRTATLFTASSDEGIERLGRAILEPEVQSDMKGDLVFIDYIVDKFKQIKFGDGASFKVTSLRAGKSFVTGEAGQISTINFYLSSNPWIYWLILTVLLLIISIIIYVILRRMRKRRLTNNEHE